MIKTAQSQSARKRAAENSRKHLQKKTAQIVRTVERRERDIKTTHRAEKAVKSVGKGSVKTAGHSVKTAEQTARTTVKTTEQAAKNAYRAAKASRKAAEKSAKTAGKATEKTVKAVAKTTVSVAKAIIAGTKALLTAIAAGGWIAILVLIVVLLFGAALSMTGGDNSSTVSPISAEVQVYEPLIRKYAKQYGIGEYVELIKAVMMQESGGQGNDPMQSSESSFNTKYPKKANGITNPEYSIECGVQEIKSCLAGAEVKSPVDMDQIKLALQGYNYGNGYIPWAKETYGGILIGLLTCFLLLRSSIKYTDCQGIVDNFPEIGIFVFGFLLTILSLIIQGDSETIKWLNTRVNLYNRVVQFNKRVVFLSLIMALSAYAFTNSYTLFCERISINIYICIGHIFTAIFIGLLSWFIYDSLHFLHFFYLLIIRSKK